MLSIHGKAKAAPPTPRRNVRRDVDFIDQISAGILCVAHNLETGGIVCHWLRQCFMVEHRYTPSVSDAAVESYTKISKDLNRGNTRIPTDGFKSACLICADPCKSVAKQKSRRSGPVLTKPLSAGHVLPHENSVYFRGQNKNSRVSLRTSVAQQTSRVPLAPPVLIPAARAHSCNQSIGHQISQEKLQAHQPRKHTDQNGSKRKAAVGHVGQDLS